MTEARDYIVQPALVQQIQDAVLIGSVKDLDAALQVASADPDFPNELRYGLETLLHFRAHYGAGGFMEPVEPMQKKQAVLLEQMWGAEVLAAVKRRSLSSTLHATPLSTLYKN